MGDYVLASQESPVKERLGRPVADTTATEVTVDHEASQAIKETFHRPTTSITDTNDPHTGLVSKMSFHRPKTETAETAETETDLAAISHRETSRQNDQ